MRSASDRPNPAPTAWHHPAARTAVLLGGPFLVRLLVWLQLRDEPFFRLLVVDARTYHDTAAAMAAGTWRLDGPFWQPPFYPVFLSWIYRVAGPNPEAARLVQSVLGALLCVVVFRIGERLFDRRAAWIAWGAAALCAPLFFFDLQILGASLAAVLIAVGVERALAWDANRGIRDAVASGLALGLAAITVATSLVLIPVFTLWAWWADSSRTPRGRRWPAPAALVAAAVAPVLIVTGLNWSVAARPVLVSYNGGVNFWIGNNPDYDRIVAIRPGRAWQALAAEPIRAGARSEAETSDWFYRRAGNWIRSEPGAWLGLTAKKVRLFLRGDEIARNQEIYPYRSASWVLRALLWKAGLAFPSGLLLPLAAAGAVAAVVPGRRRGVWLLRLTVLVFAAGVIAFFPASRYRLPILPLVLVFAGSAVGAGIDAGRARRWRPLAGPALAFTVMLLLANAAVPSPSRVFHSDAYADMGTFHYDQGRHDEAEPWYRRALDLDPDNPEAAHNYGVIQLKRGRPEQAEPLFRRVLAAWPQDVNALINLGNVYLQKGEPYRAGRYYEEARRVDPAHPDAGRNLELAREMADRLERQRMAADPEGFLRTLDRLLASEPQNLFLRERLGVLRGVR